MATVREGVMKKEILDPHYTGTVVNLEVEKYVDDSCFVMKVIERHIEKNKVNIKIFLAYNAKAACFCKHAAFLQTILIKYIIYASAPTDNIRPSLCNTALIAWRTVFVASTL